jgi:hypothetical protein
VARAARPLGLDIATGGALRVRRSTVGKAAVVGSKPIWPPPISRSEGRFGVECHLLPSAGRLARAGSRGGLVHVVAEFVSLNAAERLPVETTSSSILKGRLLACWQHPSSLRAEADAGACAAKRRKIGRRVAESPELEEKR